MAKGVVDRFEVVQIEEHHGQDSALPAHLRERLEEAVAEQDAVG